MTTITRSDLPPLKEYVAYLEKIWASKWLTNDGELVQLLEKKLSEYLDTNKVLLVTNGTSALQITLKACALNGEVITTPFTFAATTNAILWEGLTPIFADIDPQTFNIDPNDVENKITKDTSAILATHVYGNPCAVDKLQAIASKHKLKLIYDGAHAFGVQYKNRSLFNYGDLSTLSLHATKVFHTAEGGALFTKDKTLFGQMKLLRNHGIRSEEEVCLPGINAKMNELQAALGLCNLESVDKHIQKRGEHYEYYKNRLADQSVMFQNITASKYNYGYMPICFDSLEVRNKIYSGLQKSGFYPRKYFYPLTVHFNYFKETGADLVDKYGLKISMDIANRILCLPLYPDLERSDIDKIIMIIKKLIKS